MNLSTSLTANRKALLQEIVQKNPEFMDVAFADGMTVLMIAAHAGNEVRTNFWLDVGANRFLQHQGSGWTALHYAAHSQKLATTRSLCQRNITYADSTRLREMRTANGETAKQLAAASSAHGRFAVFKYLDELDRDPVLESFLPPPPPPPLTPSLSPAMPFIQIPAPATPLWLATQSGSPPATPEPFWYRSAWEDEFSLS